MEQHDFVAGPNGICEICSKPRKECITSNDVYITGLPETSGMQVNKAIIFFEQIPEACKVQQISCTKFNTFIISRSGQVFSWGETTNALGRVLEKRDDAKIPKMLYELRSKYIVSIACGESHVLVVDYDKNAWSWGFNKFGQLGQGDTVDRNLPTSIESLKFIVKIAAAAHFSYAVSENGRVYAWGDNKNFQLGQMVDESGSKQNKFLLPKLIENSPWDKTADIEIAGGNGNNYFFKSQINKVSQGGVSTYEAKKLQLENEELKRKLEYLTKKVAILEEELYKNNPDTNPKFGITQDTALQEMQSLLKINSNKAARYESELKDFEADMLKIIKEVQELEGVIAELDSKEALYWDEIEAKDNELVKMQLKKVKEANKIAEIRNKKENIQDFIKNIESTRSIYYQELNTKQELLDSTTDHKNQVKIDLIECQKQDVVYKQMISSRERELLRTYVEKKQVNVENDIITLLKIHEALKETDLENIAKSIAPSSVMSFIKISNSLLERIEGELSALRYEAKKSPLKSMHTLWDILEDNIKLRKTINNYTEGLTFQTLNRLALVYDDQEEASNSRLKSSLDFAKQIFSKGNIKFRDDDTKQYKDRNRKKIMENRKTQNKWRFC